MSLPYVITVGDGESQFHVAHAELMTGSINQGGFWSRLEGLPEDRTRKRILTDDQLTDKVLAQMIEPLTWGRRLVGKVDEEKSREIRSEEHKSELQSLMRISSAVFCLKNTPPHTSEPHRK